MKRLPALHDLGAMDVLCTDKTGTLSAGRPVLDCSVDPAGRPDPQVARWAAVNALWTLHLAELPTPDALDEAILEAAEADAPATDPLGGRVHALHAQRSTGSGPECAAAPQDVLAECEGVDALPFDPVRRSSCAVVQRATRPGTHILVVKGAAEDVLPRCTRVRDRDGNPADLDGVARDELLAHAARLAGEEGLRLLAVAVAERPARPGPYHPEDEHGLTFSGFVGLRDALAPTAGRALDDLAGLGVGVKVLTGDHPGAAARLSRDLGLPTGLDADAADGVVTGEQIDRLDDRKLAELAADRTVFARCTPEHKARVVAALRGRGHTTGFLGDGVNDLPAVQAADVGICPRGATPVTRYAADVVLAEKDLTAISETVTAGRRSSGNIATYLRIALSSNVGNVIAMLVAGVLLPFLPMFPTQVLVQNLCFDAAQLAFAFDRPGPGALRRPARLQPRALLRFVTGFGLLNSLADLATFAVLVCTVHSPVLAGPGGGSGQSAFHAGWFTENLLTQAMVLVLLRSARGAAGGGGTPGPIRIAVCGLAAVGLLLPLTPAAAPLGMTAPPPLYYLLLAVVLGLYGIALTLAKRRYERRTAEPTVEYEPSSRHP